MSSDAERERLHRLLGHTAAAPCEDLHSHVLYAAVVLRFSAGCHSLFIGNTLLGVFANPAVADRVLDLLDEHGLLDPRELGAHAWSPPDPRSRLLLPGEDV